MAKCVVLENESREGFDSLLSAFWRQRRGWAIETRIMDNAISNQPPDQDELSRLAGAFTTLAAQPNLELMHRYETRLHRIFQRALSNLILIRSLQEPDPPENIKLPNDPNPISGQLAAPEPAMEPAPPAENIKLPNETERLIRHHVRRLGRLGVRVYSDRPASVSSQNQGLPSPTKRTQQAIENKGPHI